MENLNSPPDERIRETVETLKVQSFSTMIVSVGAVLILGFAVPMTIRVHGAAILGLLAPGIVLVGLAISQFLRFHKVTNSSIAYLQRISGCARKQNKLAHVYKFLSFGRKRKVNILSLQVKKLDNELEFCTKYLRRLSEKYPTAYGMSAEQMNDRVQMLGMLEACLSADLAIIQGLSTELDAIDLALDRESVGAESSLALVVDLQARLTAAERVLREAKALRDAKVRTTELASLYQEVDTYYASFSRGPSPIEAAPSEARPAEVCACSTDPALCFVHNKPFGRA